MWTFVCACTLETRDQCVCSCDPRNVWWIEAPLLLNNAGERVFLCVYLPNTDPINRASNCAAAQQTGADRTQGAKSQKPQWLGSKAPPLALPGSKGTVAQEAPRGEWTLSWQSVPITTHQIPARRWRDKGTGGAGQGRNRQLQANWVLGPVCPWGRPNSACLPTPSLNPAGSPPTFTSTKFTL